MVCLGLYASVHLRIVRCPALLAQLQDPKRGLRQMVDNLCLFYFVQFLSSAGVALFS